MLYASSDGCAIMPAPPHRAKYSTLAVFLSPTFGRLGMISAQVLLQVIELTIPKTEGSDGMRWWASVIKGEPEIDITKVSWDCLLFSP